MSPSATPPRERGPLFRNLHLAFHWFRRRLRKFIQVSHRWIALILGLVLLVIVVSGTLLVLKPEINRVLYPSDYHHTGPTTEAALLAAPRQAEAQVKGFTAVDVWEHHGILTVTGTINEQNREVNIDPGTGQVNDVTNPYGGFFGFMDNLHECALSCEEYPGYIPLLDKSAAILGNEELTVGGLLLAITGLVLLLLALGGLYLWWPGVRRMSRGFKVRRKSAYSINYDLHKLVGLIAIPFLLMWAYTGVGFELKQFESLWYAVTPGEKLEEAPEFESRAPKGVKESTVTPAEATAVAKRLVPGAEVASINVPDESEKISSYSFWMADGFDPYRHGNYPGDVGVNVDRFDASHSTINFADPEQEGRTWANELWEWSYPMHSGLMFNGWIRLIWMLFGLVPLLLAFTGVYTWLSRKRKVRAKKRRRRYGALDAGAESETRPRATAP